MPGKKIQPDEVVEQAVRRYLDGESVEALCKYYNVSTAGFYNWVRRVKKQLLQEQDKQARVKALLATREGKARKHVGEPRTEDEAIEIVDLHQAIAQIQELKLENRKLRDRLVDILVDRGAL